MVKNSSNFMDFFNVEIYLGTKEKIRDWWEKMTFSFEDLFNVAEIGLLESGDLPDFVVGQPMEYGNVIPRFYLKGRCYTFNVCETLPILDISESMFLITVCQRSPSQLVVQS